MTTVSELEQSATDEIVGRTRNGLDEAAHRDRVITLGHLAAGLSHELAQPLLAAFNFSSVAIAHCKQNPTTNPGLVDALNQAHSQIERAVLVARRVQRFITLRDPSRESFDLNHAAAEAVGILNYKFVEQEVSIKFNLKFALPHAYADNILVQQVIVNLLRNAMEAMEQSGSEARSIEIETSLDSPDHVRLNVADHGPGLTADELKSVFTPFHSQKSNGMGLGLSLSRTIIEANGGRLWAENRSSGGAMFSFTLPVADGAT